MKLSICIPVYYGQDSIEELIKSIDKEFKSKNFTDFEVILVNDGSKDNSAKICENLCTQFKFIKFINLRKNFGENNAVMCALNYCSGEYAVIVDDDSQNPPSEIFKLLDEIEKGFDVVFANYHVKKHSLFRNLGSKFNDFFATWLMDKPKNLYLCTFAIIRRDIIDEIIKYKGPFPYIAGLILRSTDNFSSVYVEHKSRECGHSTYTLGKLIHVWLSMFVNFSIKPMRFLMTFGCIIMFSSFILTVYYILDKIFFNPTKSFYGLTTLLVFILFFGGAQCLFLGFIGEYIGKNYLDTNKTPQWVVKETIGFKSEK